jgi:acyl-coenzyme A synthetase/AMP-(fatty) acid ligase
MNDITAIFERLLSGPAAPEKEFVPGRHTYADIYGIAAGLLSQFSSRKMAGKPVCLCTEDHGIIAAALLASLAGGPVFILPYSLSSQVILETREAMKFKYAIVDNSIVLPEGVQGIRPERGTWPPRRSISARDINSLFMQLFTGGSTGKPKVWPKTPVNLFAEAAYQAGKYRFAAADLVAATVPPYHIYGLLYTVMAPFLASASVMPGIFVYPHEIVSVLRDNPVTILVSVPVHYHVLNGAIIQPQRLRMAFSSAGPLDPEDALAFYRQTGVGPEEIYGSTETGGVACRSSATGRNLLEPFECLKWKISHDRLCVKSPFISPDIPVDEHGFFMTGDRAALIADGRFTILGRADGVMKVGGKRVDLNDVQDKIKKIPKIRDIFLFSMRGRKGRDADIAAVIETDLDEIEVRQILSRVLEQYAQPRRIRIVDKMPSTSTGKYDREAIIKLFDAEQD